MGWIFLGLIGLILIGAIGSVVIFLFLIVATLAISFSFFSEGGFLNTLYGIAVFIIGLIVILSIIG